VSVVQASRAGTGSTSGSLRMLTARVVAVPLGQSRGDTGRSLRRAEEKDRHDINDPLPLAWDHRTWARSPESAAVLLPR
jgi:hypothetical protein